MQLIAPLIQAAGLIVGAILTALLAVRGYRQQRAIDRQVDLVKLRRRAYEAFIRNYNTYTNTNTDEDWTKFLNTYRTLFHVASDEFLTTAMDFYRLVGPDTPDTPTGDAYKEQFNEQYAKVILAMRSDVFEETRLPLQLIKQRLPWSWS
jgi:hypothetical protein